MIYRISKDYRAEVTLSVDDGGYYAEVWGRTGATLFTTPGFTNNAEAALKLAKAWADNQARQPCVTDSLTTTGDTNMASTIENAVNGKLHQWHMEALMFCAAHGRKHGRAGFDRFTWANGNVMAEPIIGYEQSGPCKGAAIHALPNMCISLEAMYSLCAAGWMFNADEWFSS